MGCNEAYILLKYMQILLCTCVVHIIMHAHDIMIVRNCSIKLCLTFAGIKAKLKCIDMIAWSLQYKFYHKQNKATYWRA